MRAVLALSSWAERKPPAAGVVGSIPGRPRCCATGGGAIFLPEIRLRRLFLRISPYPQKNAFLRITLAIDTARSRDGTCASRLRFRRLDRWSSTATGSCAGVFAYRFVLVFSKFLKKQGRGGRPRSRTLPIINQCALGHQWAHARIKDWAGRPT